MKASESIARLAHQLIADLRGRTAQRLAAATTPPQLVRIGADVCLILVSLGLAQLARAALGLLSGQYATWADTPLTIFSVEFWYGIPVVVVVCLAFFVLSGFYQAGTIYSPYYKLYVVARAVTGAYLLIALTSFLAPAVVPMSRSVLVLAWITSLFLMLASRIWSQLWRKYVTSAEVAIEHGAIPAARQRTILVIGGAGYIGSALVPVLLSQGCRVRVLDLLLYGEEPIASFRHHSEFELVHGDFRQVDVLVKASRGVDEVVHLGGLVGDPACAFDEELTIDINVAATRAVAEVAKGAGVAKFLFASTCSVYGASADIMTETSEFNPVSLYAQTKIASERMLLELAEPGFCPIIVRFATIYGLSGRTRFDLVVNLLTAKAVIDGEITVYGGDQWRPFLHVADAARACAALLRHSLPGREAPFIFNVGSDAENYTIRKIGELVKAQVPSARLAVNADDADQRNYRVSFDKIKRCIGFETSWTVSQGITQVLEPLRAGEITDYRSPLYSNAQFLADGGDALLARPRPANWARDLARDRGPVFPFASLAVGQGARTERELDVAARA